jgi:hypothetical protein
MKPRDYFTFTFLAYFPYFEKTEEAYEITLLSVCFPIILLGNSSVKIPLSLLGNGSGNIPLSLLGNGSVEPLQR